MPKRSNDFQRLVYLVRLNLADGAKVTESKMMRDRRTKRFREVDVCIDGHVGAHRVYVCIECRDHKRIADVTWVDMMKSKHERLDTNALILASRSGFTPEARDVAESYGIQTFTLDEVEPTDYVQLLGPDSSIWLKSVKLVVEKVGAQVMGTPVLAAETVVASPSNLVHLHDGTELCQIHELVDALLKNPSGINYFIKEGMSEHRWFEIVWAPPQDHEGRPLFMKKISPETLRAIESIRITGPCTVEISRFGLGYGKLGTVQIAWGKGIVGGREALAVACVGSDGSQKLSIHFGDSPSLASNNAS